MRNSAEEPHDGLHFDVDDVPDPADLVSLYDAVGWSAYTQDPERLERAVQQSLGVAVCWSDGSTLVGLARVVGDGVTIAYLQDVLVHPGFQRRGVGARLVDAVFAPFDDVRQHVLLTDAEPGQRAFYEALGFTEVHDIRPDPLRSFVRFRG
ncbi:GNAT family N-acetyltransferase [Leifsonia sp. NPDC058194]|uniref:GNAT family N-acetyltransferase n=1 Tax=Leifsonia sp. NPDC058194 TaxID=3346374 RepID=UPI0036DB4C50